MALASCPLCTFAAHALGDHALEAHGLTQDAFLAAHPSAKLLSDELEAQLSKDLKKLKRRAAPSPRSLTTELGGLDVPVFAGVSEADVLPLPPAYKWAS